MAKIAIHLLSALLLVSSAFANLHEHDSIYPFKYKFGVKTCYWVAQKPAERCLLTSKKKENGVVVDTHVYTHCRSTCEDHLPDGVIQDPAATDSEMKFPLLGLTGEIVPPPKKNPEKYHFKTCEWARCQQKCNRVGIKEMCPVACANPPALCQEVVGP